MQISRNIPLYREKTTRNISSFAAIYVGSAALYSFATGADTRFLAWSAILAGTEFTNMATVFDSYRVISAAATVGVCYAPQVANIGLPVAYLGVNPSQAAANPTNTDVVTADTSRLFSPVSTQMEVVEWTFPGVGVTTHQWYDVNTPSALGVFTLGNSPAVPLGATTTYPFFDIKFDLVIEFGNPK